MQTLNFFRKLATGLAMLLISALTGLICFFISDESICPEIVGIEGFFIGLFFSSSYVLEKNRNH
jgi:hypothetical protein